MSSEAGQGVNDAKSQSSWPPDDTESELLTRLALLVERGGAAHFLDIPVACADQRDFPDPWELTATAVERLLLRLLWLAYVDLDVALEDARRPELEEKLLPRSEIEWLETSDGVAHFHLERIGNDNVAGLLAHEVGKAFLAWLDGASPYRGEAAEPPTAREGTIAAVYLGLGVVAANAAQYARTAGVLRGQMSVSESEVVVTGGLTPSELIYLLAVQAVLRGPGSGQKRLGIPAHATLTNHLRERLEGEIAALAPHRDELAARLGLDLAAPRPALEREAAPGIGVERPEPELRERSAGLRTFRVSVHRMWVRGAAGFGLGILPMFVAAIVLGIVNGQREQPLLLPDLLPMPLLLLLILGPIALGTLAGAINGLRTRWDVCADPECRQIIPEATALCPGCGATVAGRIAHANERLEAEERIEAEERAARQRAERRERKQA